MGWVDTYASGLAKVSNASSRGSEAGFGPSFRSVAPSIDNRGEHLTPNYASFRNTYWGQFQPVNYGLLFKAYQENPVVFACVQTITDAVVGDGYALEGGSEGDRKDLQEFLDDSNWFKVLRDVVLSLVVFGDSYIELIREDQFKRKRFSYEVRDSLQKVMDIDCYREDVIKAYVDGEEDGVEEKPRDEYDAESIVPVGGVTKISPVDAATIRIDYNEHGETIKYIQRVLHRRVDFYPDEMVHLNINVLGDRQYGHTPLQSLLQTINNISLSEKYNAEFFLRSSPPKIVYKLPKYYSPEQTSRFVSQLQSLSPQQDMVVSGEEVAIESISPTLDFQKMQFKELLEYLNQRIFLAFGVPPILLGATDSGGGRNTAQQQMEAFDRRIRALKTEISEILNNQLFTEYNFGVKEVRMKFLEDNSRESLKKTQQAQLMAMMHAQGIVTVDEVRRVMDLPPSDEMGEELNVQQGMAQESSNDPLKVANNVMQSGSKVADPRGSIDRGERAEQVNAEQQVENKSAGYLRELAYARANSERRVGFASGSVQDKRELDDRGREVAERHEAFMREENQDDSDESPDVVQQGSISLKPKRELSRKKPFNSLGTVSTNVGGQHRYPFGATPIVPEAQTEQLRAKETERQGELREAAFNPSDNAFDLNHDRVFPKDGLTGAQMKEEGKEPMRRWASRERKLREMQSPERDEVNAAGRKVWASPDGKEGKV